MKPVVTHAPLIMKRLHQQQEEQKKPLNLLRQRGVTSATGNQCSHPPCFPLVCVVEFGVCTCKPALLALILFFLWSLSHAHAQVPRNFSTEMKKTSSAHFLQSLCVITLSPRRCFASLCCCFCSSLYLASLSNNKSQQPLNDVKTKVKHLVAYDVFSYWELAAGAIEKW